MALTTPDFDNAKRDIFNRLARELSPHLTYHSLFHTKDDVLPAAIRLGDAAALAADDRLLLETAALFHDTGFLLSYVNHEYHSISIAQNTLPGCGYSANQIDTICDLIAATRMPQSPTSFLQELLCDADLDLLGRDDFMLLNRKLLQEVAHYTTKQFTEETWLADQTIFLANHKFFTRAANDLRAAGKARNLMIMRANLASLNGTGAHYGLAT